MDSIKTLVQRALPPRVLAAITARLTAEEMGRIHALIAGARNSRLERYRRGVGVILERLDSERIADWLGFDPADPHLAVLAEDVKLATEALHHIAWAAGIAPVRRCRVCGCAEYAPCGKGCWWIAEDLCSACGPGVGGGQDGAVQRAVRTRSRKRVVAKPAKRGRSKSCRRR